MSISSRLFLVMLLVSLTLIGGMMLAAQWRFAQGVRQYVQNEDAQHAERVVQALSRLYSLRQTWEPLRQPPTRWRGFLRQTLQHEAFEGRPEASEPNPRANANLVALARRLSLHDAQGNWIAGNTEKFSNAQRLPIVVDQQTVGWLVIAPPKLRGDALRERMLHELNQGLLWIGLFALALAALASAWLARHFLHPIRQLNQAAQELAEGQLHRRITLEREDELGQLAAQFNRMAQSLENQEQDRRDWLADVSHELRTPLTILRGEIEALQDGVRPLNAQALTSLQHEVGRLDRLIGDLYQLAQADQAALKHDMRPLDFFALVREAAARFQDRFHQAGLAFEVDYASSDGHDACLIKGDAQRLHQVLANLLENSVRYTSAPGRVRLLCRQDRHELTLTLEDSAPGVPTAALPRLFERLFRVESSRSREHGGSGLGLSLCRAIVQAHGGSISAFHSNLGGLGLRLSLPLAGEQK
ncbi:MAG: ATP-binding protein [Pseudomonadota bacterium]